MAGKWEADLPGLLNDGLFCSDNVVVDCPCFWIGQTMPRNCSTTI